MKQKRKKNLFDPRGTSWQAIIGFIVGLIFASPIMIFGSNVLFDNLVSIALHVGVLVCIVLLIGIIIFAFRKPLIRKVFHGANGTAEELVIKSNEVLSSILNRDTKKFTKDFKKLSLELTAWYSWIYIYRGLLILITSLVGLIIGAGGLTIAYKQANLLDKQNEVLQNQNNFLRAQTEAADRQAAISVFDGVENLRKRFSRPILDENGKLIDETTLIITNSSDRKKFKYILPTATSISAATELASQEPGFIESLKLLVNDSEPSVREGAVKALSNLTQVNKEFDIDILDIGVNINSFNSNRMLNESGGGSVMLNYNDFSYPKFNRNQYNLDRISITGNIVAIIDECNSSDIIMTDIKSKGGYFVARPKMSCNNSSIEVVRSTFDELFIEYFDLIKINFNLWNNLYPKLMGNSVKINFTEANNMSIDTNHLTLNGSFVKKITLGSIENNSFEIYAVDSVATIQLSEFVDSESKFQLKGCKFNSVINIFRSGGKKVTLPDCEQRNIHKNNLLLSDYQSYCHSYNFRKYPQMIRSNIDTYFSFSDCSYLQPSIYEDNFTLMVKKAWDQLAKKIKK